MAERGCLRLVLLLPPLALAQPHVAEANALHLALCAGGAIDIPVPGRQHDDTCPLACHMTLCDRSRQFTGKPRLPLP